MDALFRKRPRVRWPLLVRALLAGAALGIVGIASGGLFLYEAEGLLAASTGFVLTLIFALAVGLWAGVPTGTEGRDEGDEGDESDIPLRARWFAAGIAMGIAGAFATGWSIAPGVRGAGVWRVLALLLMVAMPVYLLGLLPPTLLAWAEQREGDIEYDQNSGWGPLGTLVIGMLAGVGLGVAVAGLLFIPWIGSGPLLLATAAALIVPTLFPDTAADGVRERLLYETESALSAIQVFERVYPGQRQPERRLFQNEEEESGELVRSGAPTLAYIAAAEHWLAEVSAPGDAYLVLGGGAYTLPRRLAERDPGARVTVVELDPEVTRVAYRFFGVRSEHRIVSLHGDARAFVERAAVGEEGGQFDHIFVDVYHGNESLPFTLTTREAFEAIRRLLFPEGTVLLNAIGVASEPGSRRFWSIVRTLCEVFPAVSLYTHLGHDFPERQNLLLGAALRPDRTLPERAGLFEHWPREEWPGWEGTLVLRDLFPEQAGARVPGLSRGHSLPSVGTREQQRVAER